MNNLRDSVQYQNDLRYIAGDAVNAKTDLDVERFIWDDCRHVSAKYGLPCQVVYDDAVAFFMSHHVLEPL